MSRCQSFSLALLLSLLLGAPALAQGKAKKAGPAKPAIKISELTMDMGDHGKLLLGADGKMQSVKPVGELKPNGELVDRKGKVMFRLKPDGSIVDAEGKSELKLRPDGTLEGKKDGKTVKLVVKADGSVVVGGKPMKGVQVQGVSTPEARRLAALLLAGMLMPGKAETWMKVEPGTTVHVSPPAPKKAPAKK